MYCEPRLGALVGAAVGAFVAVGGTAVGAAVGAAGGLVAVGAAAGAVVAVGAAAGGLVAVGGTGVAVGVAPQLTRAREPVVTAARVKKRRLVSFAFFDTVRPPFFH